MLVSSVQLSVVKRSLPIVSKLCLVQILHDGIILVLCMQLLTTYPRIANVIINPIMVHLRLNQAAAVRLEKAVFEKSGDQMETKTYQGVTE